MQQFGTVSFSLRINLKLNFFFPVGRKVYSFQFIAVEMSLVNRGYYKNDRRANVAYVAAEGLCGASKLSEQHSCGFNKTQFILHFSLKGNF